MAANDRAKTNKPSIWNLFSKHSEAERTARRLPELRLEALKLAGKIQGLRKRSKSGVGTDFYKFSEYESGVHEPRMIDYKASAKSLNGDGSSRLLVREREMEVAQQVYLWCDTTNSMNFKAPEKLFPGAEQPRYTKKEAAEILTLAAAYLAVHAGERFALLGSGMALSGNERGVDRIAHELEDKAKGTQDLPKMPQHRGRALPRNSHVFIFSDFGCPMEEIKKTIRSLHNYGVKGHLVMVLDPAEVEWRYKGHNRFHGMEGEGVRVVKNSEALKEEFEARIRKRIADIEGMAKTVSGWSFSVHVTNRPLHEALLPLYGIRTDALKTPAPATKAPQPK